MGVARERNKDETLAGNSISIFFRFAAPYFKHTSVKYIDHRNVEVRAMFFNPMNVVFLPPQPFFTCGGWYNHKFVKMGDGKSIHAPCEILRVRLINNSVAFDMFGGSFMCSDMVHTVKILLLLCK